MTDTERAIEILEFIKREAKERKDIYRYETLYSETDVCNATKEFKALDLAISALKKNEAVRAYMKDARKTAEVGSTEYIEELNTDYVVGRKDGWNTARNDILILLEGKE